MLRYTSNTKLLLDNLRVNKALQYTNHDNNERWWRAKHQMLVFAGLTKFTAHKRPKLM